ncbi:alpha/beta hydrolase [Sphingomonas sp.]|uniref:alpha/beta hydrolase n=1 Tax=Sphingomonas sp. TaxID=28214 RepID=UPI0035BBC090
MNLDVLPLDAGELRPLVPQLLAVTEAGPLTREALATMRATVPAFLPRPAATPPWRWRAVPGSDGAPDVRVIVVDPGVTNGALRPAILHLHGGGFVAGSAEASLWRTQELARELDCLVVSVEYRLAPETPYPGALQDSYAALNWLFRSADELAVDRDRIAVVGESAGGGHVASLVVAARDSGDLPVRYQALIYPMLDDRTGSTVRKPAHMGAVLWNEQRNRFGWSCLLGHPAGSIEAAAGAVPARMLDLSGLPPTWIGVGSIDLFLDEDIEYARRLADAGVPVRLTVVPGAFHVFDAFGQLQIAQHFRADLIASLREALR